MGNTSAGKTSLVRTLESYCKDKKKKPRAVLTSDPKHQGLIETKVVDFAKDVRLVPKSEVLLEVKESTPGFHLINQTTENKNKEVSDENEGGDKDSEKKRQDDDIQMSFVDFAGHSEYVSCSTLFMKKKGIFLICFDTEKLAKKPIDKGYHPAIGTYFAKF